MAKFMKATFSDVSDISQYECEIKHPTYRFSEWSTSSSSKLNTFHSPSKASANSNVSVDISHITTTHTPEDSPDVFPLCDVLEHPSGWKFHSFHRHILNEQENVLTVKRIKELLSKEFPSFRESLERQAQEKAAVTEAHDCDSNTVESHKKDEDDHLEVNGYKLHLPPMLFGADLMLLSLPDKKGHLSMSPMDALYAWVAQHTQEECQQRQLNVPKVPYANKWIKRMISEQVIEGATVTDAPFTDIQASDWTFSTDYCVTFHHPVSSGQTTFSEEVVDYEELLPRSVLRAFNVTQCSSPNLRVEVAGQSGIDIDMLRRRDLPILFYDELTLFEDDLEDCGEVSMDAKIRVMPTCWFILAKFFVRIDHVIVRCRETRLFHKFGHTSSDGKLIVNIDVTWREKNLQNEGPASSNIMRSRFGKNNTNDLPMVNEKLGIPQSFTLFI